MEFSHLSTFLISYIREAILQITNGYLHKSGSKTVKKEN